MTRTLEQNPSLDEAVRRLESAANQLEEHHTELRRDVQHFERELRDAHRRIEELNRMAAEVHRETRSPLDDIRNLVAELSDHPGLDDAGQESLQRLLGAATGLAAIVSRCEQGLSDTQEG